MKYKEISSLATEELTSKLLSEKEMMDKLKFAHAVSPIENPMKIRAVRKTIAQIKTELSKRKQ